MDERCAALAVRLLGEALGAWGGCAGPGAAASDESPLLGAAADHPAGAGLAPAGLEPCGVPAVPLADLAGMWAQAHEVLSAVRPMLSPATQGSNPLRRIRPECERRRARRCCQH